MNQALKAAATGARQKTILDYLDERRVRDGLAAVAGKYLGPERMLKLCVNAVKRTPRLLECDAQSVLGAMMASTALGLEPNTPQQQAFLIPYKRNVKRGSEWSAVTECQFQIGARGYVTLAYRSPYIAALAAEAIHEGDVFEHGLGSHTFLKYAKTLRERGPLVGAFSHVRLREQLGESACVLPLDELLKIRARSETYRALQASAAAGSDKRAQDKLAETPWVMWEDDMAAKSAIKKHAKQLPIASGDSLLAAANLEGDGAQVDWKALTDPEAVRAVVGDGMEPPALEHDTQTAETTAEIFGSRELAERAAQEPVEPRAPDLIAAAGKKAAAQVQPRQPGGPSAAHSAPAIAPRTLALFVQALDNCREHDDALLVLDEARSTLGEPEHAELTRRFEQRFGAGS